MRQSRDTLRQHIHAYSIMFTYTSLTLINVIHHQRYPWYSSPIHDTHHCIIHNTVLQTNTYPVYTCIYYITLHTTNNTIRTCIATLSFFTWRSAYTGGGAMLAMIHCTHMARSSADSLANTYVLCEPTYHTNHWVTRSQKASNIIMKNVRTSNGRTTLEFDCFNCRVFVAALFAVAVKFKGKARVFVDSRAVDFADGEILKRNDGAGGAVLWGRGWELSKSGGNVGKNGTKMTQRWQKWL